MTRRHHGPPIGSVLLIGVGLLWLVTQPRRQRLVSREPEPMPPPPAPEDDVKPIERPRRPRRTEILNALMYRCASSGLQFVWPHSSRIAEYQARGFVLLIDAATIEKDEARSAEIQRIRQEEEDRMQRFVEWQQSHRQQ